TSPEGEVQGRRRRPEKKTLSINIRQDLYQRLQQEIGRGKIGQFLEKVLLEKLNQQEQESEKAYKEISQDRGR
ncbi:18470_t:CDS:2, partial [Funneliformis geosporum]